MSRVVDVCIVVDTNSNNAEYVKSFQQQFTNICKDISRIMNSQLRVALVRYYKYCGEDKIYASLFINNLHMAAISKLIPVPTTTTNYQQPVNVFAALKVAVDCFWQSKDRILILIGHNPPYGKMFHNLYNDTLQIAPHYSEILRQIADLDIKFLVLNIDGSLTKLNELWKEQSSKDIKVTFRSAQIKSVKEISKTISSLIKSITSHNNNPVHDQQKNDNDIDDNKCQNIDTINELKWYKDANNKLIPVYICKRNINWSYWTVFDGQKKMELNPNVLISNNKLQQSMIESTLRILKNAYDLYIENERVNQEKDNLKREIQAALEYKKKKMVGNIRWVEYEQKFFPTVIAKDNGTSMLGNDAAGWWPIDKTKIFSKPTCNSSDVLIDCIKQLKDLAEKQLIEKTIKCGQTRCQYVANSFYGMNTYAQGTICGIVGISSTGFLQIQVKPETVFSNKFIRNLNQITILDYNAVNKKLNQKIQENVLHMQDQTTEITRWMKTARQRQQDLDQQKNDLNDKIKKENALTIKINSQLLTIKQLTNQCCETKDTFDDISKKYLKLKATFNQLRKENEERKKLVQILRGRLLDRSSALDLSIGFPPIQDILTHFETIKFQYQPDAAKPIKNVLKKRKSDLSKIRRNKITHKILFNILVSSYSIIQAFEQEQFNKIADVHGIQLINNIDNQKRKKIHKLIIRTFKYIINKNQKQLIDKVLNEYMNVFKSYGLSDNDISTISIYIKECILVCWEIVLARDPSLTISPLIFEPINKNIEFNDKLHSEGYGSEITECLNFYVWPAIFRNDTKTNISKIDAVFLNNLPKWSRKKLKQQKAQRKKEEEEAEMLKRVKSINEKEIERKKREKKNSNDDQNDNDGNNKKSKLIDQNVVNNHNNNDDTKDNAKNDCNVIDDKNNDQN